jgi:hypothetical protein
MIPPSINPIMDDAISGIVRIPDSAAETCVIAWNQFGRK